MPARSEQAKRGRGRPSMGPSTDVLIRMPDVLVEKMKATAAAAEISNNELVRRAVEFCCSPDALERIFTEMHIERTRKDRDEQRQKSKPGRRRIK
jgi:hypothetical protein